MAQSSILPRAVRGPCDFRQRNVTAAVKALAAAGHEVSGLELFPDGRIRVLVGETIDLAPADDLDAELQAFEARYGQR